MITALVVGAGPAGLMAAETLARRGVDVTVLERCTTPARKFLLAGRGGLNLTHSEDLPQFLQRYGTGEDWLRSAIGEFDPGALRDWAGALGHPTTVGSSGRVFPTSFRSTELLRSWLVALGDLGVALQTRVQFLGFSPRNENEKGVELRVQTESGSSDVIGADLVVLAMGGGSWPRTGSDGMWVSPLRDLGVCHNPFTPANGGYRVDWTPLFQERFAGVPLKNVSLTVGESSARGDAMITSSGIEGGPLYALSDALHQVGTAPSLTVDLAPDLSRETIRKRLSSARPKQTMNKLLERSAHLSPVAISLLREITGNKLSREPVQLTELVKAARLSLLGPQSIDRAISSRGGIVHAEVDKDWMLTKCPGVFVAGEMLDWSAPTGGYLLQACFATGKAAAKGALRWFDSRG